MNTRARLETLYHDRQSLDIQSITDGTRVVISVPFRTAGV